MTHHRRDEAATLIAGGGVVALTGAGISQESGIPTFRDPGGIWERFDPDVYGTWDGVMRLAMERPDDLASFLAELRAAFAGAEPGPAHAALARLERAGLLDAVITQNVDGLHQRAGSRHVVEVHGSFSRTLCLVCGNRETASSAEFLAALDRVILGLRTAFIASMTSLLPACSRCGGPARPDFVAFGELPQDMAQAEELARGARVFLVVGTHGEVFPAGALPEEAAGTGATVIEVSRGHTEIRADIRLRGEAGRVLPPLVEAALTRAGRA
ncbi:MAG TPA: Sir2 family NAD-dependent protein deacetylase [Actinomycetota bacterium]